MQFPPAIPTRGTKVPSSPECLRPLTETAMAMGDDKKSGGKIEDERSKAWQLRISLVDGSQIELVAEADTRDELRRLSDELRRLSKEKRRPEWRCRTYHNGLPVPRP
jgi:hypothetical protein